MQAWYNNVVETMGTSLTSLSQCNPPLPAVIQADPEASAGLDVVTAKLGFFGYTSDYGVWNHERPSSSSEQSRRLWLWIHKRHQEHVGRKFTVLSLENFSRGTNPNGSGQILYSALFQAPSSSFIPYVYYLKTPLGRSSYQPVNNENMREHVVSTHDYRWKMYNIVEIVNGTSDRYQKFYSTDPQPTPSLVSTTQMEPTAETLGSANLVLEVFATGHCERTHIRRENFRRITLDEKKKSKQPGGGDIYIRRNARGEEFVITETEHDELKKQVTQIDFRLCKDGVVLGEWKLTKQNDNDHKIDSPYFHFHSNSGWFVRTTNRIEVKPLINIDSAAALLLAHLCINYLSTNPIEQKIPDPPSHIVIADVSIGIKPWVAHYDRQPTQHVFSDRQRPTPPPLPPRSTHLHIPSQAPTSPPVPPEPTAPPLVNPAVAPSAPPLVNLHVSGVVEEEVPIATLLEVVDDSIPVATASIVLPTATRL